MVTRLASSFSDTEIYKTLLVMVTGFLAAGYLFGFPPLYYVSGGIGVVGLASRAAGKWLVWGWFKIAFAFGWINTRVLLSVVFYLLVTPIGWMFRLSGNDSLRLKKPEKSNYNWREQIYAPEHLKNPW